MMVHLHELAEKKNEHWLDRIIGRQKTLKTLFINLDAAYECRLVEQWLLIFIESCLVNWPYANRI